MKTIHIILIVLAILGVGLFVTQKLWVPTVPVVSNDGMEDWNWVSTEISAQGTQFMYPNPLPTKFVTAQDWPPVVEIVAGEFSCTEGDAITQDGVQQHLALRTIGNHTYCVGTSSEGAAGSTYTSYEYSTKQGDSLVRVVFTLRMPQCLNYDEPDQTECKAEQASFNADALADRIVSSIRTQ
ncbi:MAG: hypothetical protein V4449_03670 [Patescibacteria group bacterium]